jgi:hypothetical protein
LASFGFSESEILRGKRLLKTHDAFFYESNCIQHTRDMGGKVDIDFKIEFYLMYYGDFTFFSSSSSYQCKFIMLSFFAFPVFILLRP